MRSTYSPLPLSPAALARIEDVARSFGAKPRLAEAVAALSRVYTREREQLAKPGPDSLLARAGFFFPRDLVKPFGPLDELHATGTLPARKRLRVLDLGAGMGATSFGVARWLRVRALPVDALEVVALERDAAALRAFSAFGRALRELGDEFVPIELEPRAQDVRTLRGDREFDLVLFGFVLNELFLDKPVAERIERRAELVLQTSELLARDGALIVLEPALKETTRELMQLRDRIAARGKPFIIAPCLHDLGCPMLRSERDWCHQELAYALPPKLAEVARAASLRWEGLSYASLVLANQPRPPALRDGLHRVVSDRLESKGKLELYGCGEGELIRFAQLTRKITGENRAFAQARRGHVLSIAREGAPPTRIEADSPVERVQ